MFLLKNTHMHLTNLLSPAHVDASPHFPLAPHPSDQLHSPHQPQTETEKETEREKKIKQRQKKRIGREVSEIHPGEMSRKHRVSSGEGSRGEAGQEGTGTFWEICPAALTQNSVSVNQPKETGMRMFTGTRRDWALPSFWCTNNIFFGGKNRLYFTFAASTLACLVILR